MNFNIENSKHAITNITYMVKKTNYIYELLYNKTKLSNNNKISK